MGIRAQKRFLNRLQNSGGGALTELGLVLIAFSGVVITTLSAGVPNAIQTGNEEGVAYDALILAATRNVAPAIVSYTGDIVPDSGPSSIADIQMREASVELANSTGKNVWVALYKIPTTEADVGMGAQAAGTGEGVEGQGTDQDGEWVEAPGECNGLLAEKASSLSNGASGNALANSYVLGACVEVDAKIGQSPGRYATAAFRVSARPNYKGVGFQTGYSTSYTDYPPPAPVED